MTNKIKQVIYTAILMIIGSIVFKTIPMDIFGQNILFDASRHIMVACFVLYVLFLFIKDKSWVIPYFMMSFAVLMIISFQRIISNAHNDVGLLMGFVLSLIAIIIPRWGEFKKHLNKIK